MALVLNEEQTMLRDAARDFLGARAPVSHLRELRDHGGPDGFSRELWAEMAELGWSAILVPEDHGGLGYGYTGLGLVLEETGRTLTPSPLLGTALTAVTALNLAGTPAQRAAVLPGIASGKRILSLACDETSAIARTVASAAWGRPADTA
jgi:acyl-CoA dehydrogenase